MATESTTHDAPQADDAAVLSAEEVKALRAARSSWEGVPTARTTLPGSPVDPDLGGVETRGSRPGERYVKVVRSHKAGFLRVQPGVLQATTRTNEPTSDRARRLRRVRTAVIGNPLASADAIHERLTKVKALAVLSSDALSSVAYATEQILFVLAAGGTAAYAYSLPIAGAILGLLLIVVLSYRQTIRAYPKGGGSYIVASDNLGPIPGLIAGCALMTSYILTVAVSVGAGVDSIVSAADGVRPFKLAICVGFVALLVLGNLRGIRESGSIFALPTYLFILGMFAMFGTIAVRALTGTLVRPSTQETLQGTVQGDLKNLSIVLVLQAFAQGASALTGVEAISDGVPAFKAPEWKNAQKTLAAMGVILGLMFIGTTVITYGLKLHAKDPNATDGSYQTIISQIAHVAFGSGPGYLFIIVVTCAILVLAGNTAFSDFPRLFFFMARDDYAPHQFKRLGERLAFSNGILLLGFMASLLLVLFNADVGRLIPLYAIGVFTAFTMSQAGMVARWLRLREKRWQLGLAMNSLGVCATALVFLINGVFKFTQGSWIILVVVPLLVVGCRSIHHHYVEVRRLQRVETPTSPKTLNPVCIVPVVDLNGIALQSLAMARTLSDIVIAVHINDDEAEITHLRAKWDEWGNHVPLEVIESPYRAMVRPLMAYLNAIDQQNEGDTIVVVLPELVASRWWHHALHNQTAFRLKAALLFRPGTVVISVPYHIAAHAHRSRRTKAREHRADDDAL